MDTPLTRQDYIDHFRKATSYKEKEYWLKALDEYGELLRKESLRKQAIITMNKIQQAKKSKDEYVILGLTIELKAIEKLLLTPNLPL